jgi:glycosyltransferase involved in cell wall biosynthesis
MKSPTKQPTNGSPPDASPFRLAIVTRRFWPFAGSTEFAVGDLASTLKGAGHDVHVFTVRWEKNWPSEFQYLELPVRRINRPAGPWGSFRYLRSLTRELTQLNPDGIIVFGLGDEAWTIARSFTDKIPFLIRIDNHLLADSGSQPNFTRRQISALNAASNVLVESDWTADRIHGHPAVKSLPLMVVPDGIIIDPDHQRTPAGGGSSRVAISDAHPILMIEPGQPLVVCGSPLGGDEGLIDLVNAWPRVIDRFPDARLWILGDGKKGHQIWGRVVDQNLVNSVIMPGGFDNLNDVFQAADVCVHPLRSDESCSFMNRALVSGVCVVATSTGATRSMVEPKINGLLVSPEDPRGLADAIILALGDDELRDRLGRAAVKSNASTYDIDNLVCHFLDPLRNSMNQEPASTTTETASNP